MSSQNIPNVSLVFWNLDVKDAPHISTVRDCLTAANFEADRAADVPPTTAMSRAASAIKSKETETKTYTSRDDKRPRVQIDELTELDGRLKRTFHSAYELDEETETPRLIGGPGNPDFLPAFDSARTHYTGADISKVIQSILTQDGLGAYSPRKNGGVYFVPVAPTATDFLSRIERFCTPLGVRFLVYEVPDLDSQRAEIADAICEAFNADIDAHAAAIAEYTIETRPGILENRRSAIQATYETMQKIRPLCNGRYNDLRQKMADCLSRLTNLDTEREAREAQANADRERQEQDAADMARVENRRQIVTS